MNGKAGGSGDLDPSDFDFGGDDAAPPPKGGSDFDFGFEDMPTPQKAGGKSVAFAAPVDDGGFGEDDSFGGPEADAADAPAFPESTGEDAFAPQDFGDTGGAFDAPPAARGEAVFEADAGDGFGQESEVDAFVVEETTETIVAEVDPDAIDQEVEEAGDGRTFLQRFMFPIAAAVAGVLVLGVGYMMFAPMLMPAPAPVQQQLATGSNSPTGMPNAPVGQQPTGPAPSLPGNGQGEPIFATDTGEAPALPGMNLDQTPAPAPVETADTPRDPAPVLQLDPAGSSQKDDEIAALEQQVRTLTEQVTALTGQLAALEARPAAPATPEPVVIAQDKPPVVDGWTLRGVEGDVAWIEGPDGFVEVQVGTEVPGAGRVTNISMYENEWLVVTTNGVILKN